jgi:glucan phosphoethanolaminetransferase (alkaline phosphatase superfamily)
MLKNTIAYILGSLFTFGLLGTIFNVSTALIKAALIPYSVILVTLVLYLFSAVILNNIRINKIKKELGINSDEYDALVSKYY